MLGTTDINKLFDGVDKYAKFYGYNKTRTVVGPNLGENPLTQVHVYKGEEVELVIKIDKPNENWVVRAIIVNELGETEWEQEIESDMDDLDKLAKQVQDDILKQIPRNKIEGVRAEESVFLDDFVRGNLYIIEGEYNALFEE